MFEGICDAIHDELHDLEAKYAEGGKLTEQELEHIDTMAHALKCLKTYEAMAEYGDYDRYPRGRRPSGRYTGRDGGRQVEAGRDTDTYRRY